MVGGGDDPQVVGPSGVAATPPPMSLGAESSPDLERTGIADDFASLHLRPWVFADHLRLRAPQRGFVVKAFIGLAVATWIGAMAAWNLGGRHDLLSQLEGPGLKGWRMLETQLRMPNLRQAIYMITFWWKQTGLVVAPLWALLPTVAWAGLTTAGLWIMGKRESNAFPRLVLLGVVAQWLSLWRAVPVTGEAIADISKFLFLGYSVKRSFDLSFNRAVIAMYALPLVVILGTLFVALALSFTI